ncbi:hypothetical protein BJ979_000169 [Schumannella luteola]|uniref:Uncharacterized protein n=1 Tax=Schumannella luteola TaxID=472059 RepID=A0A852Y5M0_9MICO|nr:hypothetical protein [Schumannella luteola]
MTTAAHPFEGGGSSGSRGGGEDDIPGRLYHGAHG